MTLREIVYMVLDEIKNLSDDRYFEEEHVIFLADKYRAFLLKQRYGTDLKKSVPESNYQTICLPLEEPDMGDIACYTGPRLVSSHEIPSFMNIGTKRIFPMKDFTTVYFTLVSRDRFNYVGINKWLTNIIYATKGPDDKLYLKSGNPQHKYLKEVKLNAVFADFQKASELECDNMINSEDSEACHIKPLLDREFPLEPALVPPLVELIVKELIPAVYKPEDTVNNAADDLAKVQNESK